MIALKHTQQHPHPHPDSRKKMKVCVVFRMFSSSETNCTSLTNGFKLQTKYLFFFVGCASLNVSLHYTKFISADFVQRHTVGTLSLFKMNWHCPTLKRYSNSINRSSRESHRNKNSSILCHRLRRLGF